MMNQTRAGSSSRLLMRAHAQVREADSVAGALEVLAEWSPDILVSDIAMPGEDGYSLVRHLRASPSEAQLAPACRQLR